MNKFNLFILLIVLSFMTLAEAELTDGDLRKVDQIVDQKVDAAKKELKEEIRVSEKRINDRLVTLEKRIYRYVDVKIDALRSEMIAKFEGIQKQFEGIQKQFEGIQKQFDGVMLMLQFMLLLLIGMLGLMGVIIGLIRQNPRSEQQQQKKVMAELLRQIEEERRISEAIEQRLERLEKAKKNNDKSIDATETMSTKEVMDY